MGPRLCQVCNEAPSKYKCPKCVAPYCSLVCFKKHKEVPCATPVSQDNQSSVPQGLHINKPISVEGRNELLEKSQLEAIAASSEIHNALNDENLRKLISAIDSSPDPETELDKAMLVETFNILSSKILSTIGR